MTYVKVSECSNTRYTSEGLLWSFRFPMLGQFPCFLLTSQTMYSELGGKEECGYLGWNTSSTLCHVALSKLPNFIKSEISPSAKSYLPCKLS